MGYFTGKVSPESKFPASDVRSGFPRFTREAMIANQPLVDLLKKVATEKKYDACPNCASVATGQKTVYRANSRDD